MSGFVYLIGTSIFGWYKIGKSVSPEIRVRDLGILLPFKIKVYAIWKAENHHLMESTLHEIYNSNQINGEWFEFTGEELGRLIESIPEESRIYLDNNDRFSNVEVDTRESKRVLGVRKEKLRGNFTDEEREHRKFESMEQKRKNKEAGLSNKGLVKKINNIVT